MRWLSYVPATANDLKPGMLAPADPVDRPRRPGRRPTARLMMCANLDNADGTGLFDKGSFTETLAGGARPSSRAERSWAASPSALFPWKPERSRR